MILETYIENKIKVIRVTGEIGFENYGEFEESLSRVTAEANKVILDFSELTYLNSMGLSTIIKMYSKLKKNESSMILCNLNENIKKLFTITKLDKIILIKNSLYEAKQALCEQDVV